LLVMLIILVILTILFNLYAVVDIGYNSGKLDYCVRYSGIKLLSSDSVKKKDKKKQKNKPEKEIKTVDADKPDKNKKKSGSEVRKKKKKKQSVSDILEKAEAIIDFIKASEKHILRLIGNIRFSKINVDFVVAHEDAYDCAIRYGLVSAGVYNILAFISSYFRTSVDNVNIGLKYNNNNSIYNFGFSLKLKLGTGIIAALGILLTYLRSGLFPLKTKNKKSQKKKNNKECLKMSNHQVNGLMGTTIEKIREMIDVNTIIGNPISTPEGATIIPVSKVSFGFASGGSDLPSKQQKELFGGAAGAGVSVQPLAFICVSPKGDVKLLQMSVNATKENAMISTLPDLLDKIAVLVGKDKDKDCEKKKSAPEEQKENVQNKD